MQHNFFPAMVMSAGAVLALHYPTVAACPVVVAEGPSQTGKSTSILVTLSIFGKWSFSDSLINTSRHSACEPLVCVCLCVCVSKFGLI